MALMIANELILREGNLARVVKPYRACISRVMLSNDIRHRDNRGEEKWPW